MILSSSLLYLYRKERDTMNNYITYIYLDTTRPGQFKYGHYLFDYEPFYVGEGVYTRRLDHLQEAKNNSHPKYANKHKFYRIKKLLTSGTPPIIKIIADNLNKSAAQQLEINLIALIGRRDLENGPLLNLTVGGDVNPVLCGNKNPMYGKTWNAARRLSHSQKIKTLNASLTKLEYDAKYKRPCSDAAKLKLRKALSGKGNPMYGHHHSIETKRKIGEKAKLNCVGENNPRAERWKVITPSNEMLIVTALHSFCKKRGMCADSLKLAGRNNRKVIRGPSKGWSAKIAIDKL